MTFATKRRLRIILIEKKLAHSELFKGLEPAEIKALLESLTTTQKNFESGEYVQHINDTYDKIGMVISGSVHMIAEDFWGNRNLIRKFEPLEFYGDAHSLTLLPMFFDIIAVKPSELLFIKTSEIFTPKGKFGLSQQILLKNMISIMSHKKLEYMHKADFLSNRSIRDKISAYLSEQARRKCSNEFQIPYNRQDFADFLAVDRSALSRELAKMQKEGIIKFHKDHFVLIDEKRDI